MNGEREENREAARSKQEPPPCDRTHDTPPQKQEDLDEKSLDAVLRDCPL
jgi:hypothetical protein